MDRALRPSRFRFWRRRAEFRFEEVFDLSLDLLCIGGLDGYFKRVNPAFRQAFGYSNEELLSRPFLDFVHPEDRERSREPFAQLTRGQEVVRFQNRNIRADGSTLWLEWSSRPLPQQGVFFGTARDVTDRKLADAEQEALRHVATLVARGGPRTEIFSTVAEEVRRLFGADLAAVARFEPGGAAVLVVGLAQRSEETPIPTRWPVDAPTAMAEVFRTGRPARVDFEDPSDVSGPMADEVRRVGNRSMVSSPIIVEGRLWGVIGMSTKTEPLPPDTEGRLANFTELVATAIANAESRAELAASRARVVAASADERQRVVRDLHDGAQQRLVHAVITLKLALRELDSDGRHSAEFVKEALDHAQQANAELRELVHGILPGVLTSGGLRAGVEELASHSTLPVTVDVPGERFPTATEATAYFVVSEALTNVVKHADAQAAAVAAHVENGALRVEVRDDGIGGADPEKGSGLTGLRDRVEALGGTIEIVSPGGTGTSLFVKIPIDGA